VGAVLHGVVPDFRSMDDGAAGLTKDEVLSYAADLARLVDRLFELLPVVEGEVLTVANGEYVRVREHGGPSPDPSDIHGWFSLPLQTAPGEADQ